MGIVLVVALVAVGGLYLYSKSKTAAPALPAGGAGSSPSQYAAGSPYSAGSPYASAA